MDPEFLSTGGSHPWRPFRLRAGSNKHDPFRPPEQPASVQYNVVRMRMEAWNQLRDHARRLALAHRTGADSRPWKEEVARELEALRPYESYWAFPGLRGFEKLAAFFQQGAYDAFAQQTARIVQLLAKDSYRRMDLSTTRLSEYADLVNVSGWWSSVQGYRRGAPALFRGAGRGRPHPEQESELRLQLRALRSPDDEFIYELVVARSFEDAMVAVLLNDDIQSVVVRYVFPFHSSGAGLALTPEADALLGEDHGTLASLLGSVRSRRLGRAQAPPPELDLFLVTDSPWSRWPARRPRPSTGSSTGRTTTGSST
jgi:arginine decarboxylase